MIKHSDGLWRIVRFGNFPNCDTQIMANRFAICKLFGSDDGLRLADRRLAEANAERIVACVNACEGINPDAVPYLLEACKAEINRMEMFGANSGPVYSAMKAALSKAGVADDVAFNTATTEQLLKQVCHLRKKIDAMVQAADETRKVQA